MGRVGPKLDSGFQMTSPMRIIFWYQCYSHLFLLLARFTSTDPVSMNSLLLRLVSPGVLAPFLVNVLPVLELAVLVAVVSHLALAASQQGIRRALLHVERSQRTGDFYLLPTVDGAVEAHRHEGGRETLLFMEFMSHLVQALAIIEWLSWVFVYWKFAGCVAHTITITIIYMLLLWSGPHRQKFPVNKRSA